MTLATRSRAPAITTLTSNPTSPLTPASITKAASTSCLPGPGRTSIVARLPLLQGPPLLQVLLSHAFTRLIRKIRARPSPTGPVGASAGMILRLMPSCRHPRPSLVLGLPRRRRRASIAPRLRLLATFLMAVRMRRHHRAVLLSAREA